MACAQASSLPPPPVAPIRVSKLTVRRSLSGMLPPVRIRRSGESGERDAVSLVHFAAGMPVSGTPSLETRFGESRMRARVRLTRPRRSGQIQRPRSARGRPSGGHRPESGAHARRGGERQPSPRLPAPHGFSSWLRSPRRRAGRATPQVVPVPGDVVGELLVGDAACQRLAQLAQVLEDRAAIDPETLVGRRIGQYHRRSALSTRLRRDGGLWSLAARGSGGACFFRLLRFHRTLSSYPPAACIS